MIYVLIGIPLSILSSLTAWWLIFHYICPRIEFRDTIWKQPEPKSKFGYKYKFAFKNMTGREIYDITISVRLRIECLPDRVGLRWVNLRCFRDTIPRLERRDSEGKNGYKQLKFYPEVTTDDELNILPNEIAEKSRNGELTLEELLSIGSSSRLQIIVSGVDSFTGTRRYFESKLFKAEDIKAEQGDVVDGIAAADEL